MENQNHVRLGALIVALLWAAFWSYFVVAATISEPGTVAQKLMICLVGVSVLCISALSPWVFERGGAILLTLEGAALCIANFTYLHNPPATQAFLLFTLAAPPLIAGVALFWLLQTFGRA